jgi:hypothetical protein
MSTINSTSGSGTTPESSFFDCEIIICLLLINVDEEQRSDDDD